VEQRDPKGLYKKARAGEIRGAEIIGKLRALSPD
jgi:adenylylsulfate kinase-like enzyme